MEADFENRVQKEGGDFDVQSCRCCRHRLYKMYKSFLSHFFPSFLVGILRPNQQTDDGICINVARTSERRRLDASINPNNLSNDLILHRHRYIYIYIFIRRGLLVYIYIGLLYHHSGLWRLIHPGFLYIFPIVLSPQYPRLS